MLAGHGMRFGATRERPVVLAKMCKPDSRDRRPRRPLRASPHHVLRECRPEVPQSFPPKIIVDRDGSLAKEHTGHGYEADEVLACEAELPVPVLVAEEALIEEADCIAHG
jgi:hypothetical protein